MPAPSPRHRCPVNDCVAMVKHDRFVCWDHYQHVPTDQRRRLVAAYRQLGPELGAESPAAREVLQGLNLREGDAFKDQPRAPCEGGYRVLPAEVD